jgi:hypothetical protein
MTFRKGISNGVCNDMGKELFIMTYRNDYKKGVLNNLFLVEPDPNLSFYLCLDPRHS